MKPPEGPTAEVFPRYLRGEVLADSATLKWSGLFARRYRFSRVVDGFLVPATAEPLITCILNGSAEFQERDVGGEHFIRDTQTGIAAEKQLLQHHDPLADASLYGWGASSAGVGLRRGSS